MRNGEPRDNSRGTIRRPGISRRTLLVAGVLTAAAVVGGARLRHVRRFGERGGLYPSRDDAFAKRPMVNGMPMRPFGSTGMIVSEVGFGAWGIGGTSYGSVERRDALNALAKAEELGCNFIDTALVYGVSEEIIGEFMQGRRNRWVIATKFTRQPEGLTATVERQLKRLRTDVIDFYQIHWYPRDEEESLFDEMNRLRQSGKIRFAGVSLYSKEDISDALENPDIDGFQVAFSLLEPDPFLSRARNIRAGKKAVIVRSALADGFLTGKYKRDATFPDTTDIRHQLTREQIAETVDRVESFRFLEQQAGSMVAAAAAYPLSFPEVSTVILGTKNASQAAANFGEVPGKRFSAATLARISDVQFQRGIGSRLFRVLRKLGVG